MLRLQRTLAMLAILSVVAQPAQADITVWLDFTSDLQDGNGNQGANGQADWIQELNQATASAGVANFSTAERALIESEILSQLNTIYADYRVDFTTTDPGGSFDTIYFGVEPPQNGVLGFAPLDIGNQFTGQLTNVAPESFGFFIESGDARVDQIAEITAGLAGTAAHELGHSVGLLHHHVYSDPGITPATYANTNGLQNQYILATGSTGLTEQGRETLRSFSPFEQVMLDITGGSQAVFAGQDNDSLVLNPVFSDRGENNGADAGATIDTAYSLTSTVGETSGYDIWFAEADLDGSGADIDVFELTVTQPGQFSAHVYSSTLVYGPGAEFDPQIELLNSNGTVVASNDDVRYDGNTYDSGTVRSLDSFLNNITLANTGTYYLRVTGVADTEVGSNYWVVAAHSPEPSSFFLMLLAGTTMVNRRRKRHEAATA